MIPALHPGAVQDALNATVIHPVFELSIGAGFVLPETLEDRFLCVDTALLQEGHCVASIGLDGAGGHVVSCCFQVILKTDTFAMLYRTTQHPAVPTVVRYNFLAASKVVAFHGMGVAYMLDLPHLFKFQNDNPDVIKGASTKVVEPVTAGLNVGSTHGSGTTSMTESAARQAAILVKYVVFANVDRMREVAPDNKASLALTVPAILATMSADSPIMGTKATWANLLFHVAQLNFVDARMCPVVTSATQAITVGISPLHLVEEYDGVTPIDNNVISKAITVTLQALDLVQNVFDTSTGMGYFEQLGQGLVYLFQPGMRRNVLAFSPAYNIVVVQELFTRLRTNARTEHLPPLTPAQIRQEVVVLMSEFTFSKFQDGYPAWQAQNAVANIQWHDVIRQSATLQQTIQSGAVGFSVSSSGSSASVVGSGQDGPVLKKAKKGNKTGAAKVQSAGAAAGGAGIAGGGGSTAVVLATTGTLPAGQIGKSCKFNVKHIFLNGPKCKKDAACPNFHQRGIKKGAAVRADLLQWAAVFCVNDSDYDDLKNAIVAKT